MCVKGGQVKEYEGAHTHIHTRFWWPVLPCLAHVPCRNNDHTATPVAHDKLAILMVVVTDLQQ